MNFKSTALRSLMLNAEKDAAEAMTSLEIMFNHPAGIGDHSTTDLHDNLNEALSQLADADDRLETLKKYYKEFLDQGE